MQSCHVNDKPLREPQYKGLLWGARQGHHGLAMQGLQCMQDQRWVARQHQEDFGGQALPRCRVATDSADAVLPRSVLSVSEPERV